ncbi:dihydrofolate reductase family protein [Kutzneria chonburiensis]|uniref:Dihydrofolate reductase family protein n=1 Tax=Kutzneria chonburiensis TaxID=1483604 RepID=A0ABV6MUN2_9PSEU|nr:dihydrofolate reductase family protein [Kutzneria chonburiensis]
MKLTTMTQIALDGVVQDNGRWARGAGDDSTRAFINETYQRADAFLFGRRTYELFTEAWGTSTHPVGLALRQAPKYVASTTLTDASWSGSTVLPDVAAIADLKAKPGGELQVHGSGTLIRSLLAHGLVDEMTLIVVPVIVGHGTRLFPENGPDLALDLVESRVDSKGVTIQVLRPAGRPKYFGA